MHASRAASLVVVLVLAPLAVTACTSTSKPGATPTSVTGPRSSSAPSPSSAAPTTATTTTALSGAEGGPVPAGFVPVSATFVSTRTAWVLGTAPCPSAPCTSIVRTVDGGTTWVGIPTPHADLSRGHPGGIRSLRFADAVDGWAFGPDLWTTHDGGGHWSQTRLPGVTAGAVVMALEAAGGTVHAAVLDGDQFRIETSPATADAWTASPTTVPVGAGPVPRAQLVLQGSAGWLVEVDRTVIGGARLDAGRWVPWDPPCGDRGGPAELASSSPTDLVAVCDEGEWNDAPRAVRFYVSADGGTTFHPAPTPLPLSCCPVGVASPEPSTAVVASNGAAGTPVVVATFDAGTTWSTVSSSTVQENWDEIGFTSAAQGVAVRHASDATSGTMLLTVDGGHTWRPVTFR